jgi:hypothetical protein
VDPTVLRVAKGSPSTEELAALTVALLVLAASPGTAAGEQPAVARWHRPERVGGFEGPRTWRSAHL